ncbi:DUF3576 domain-containing protein [Tritonibacter scottomollicae]|uniref:DUF3576 domain-containing protein n=1 Tax=Tritonibacter scottomollicae TaxID=483013 RepID=A0ABZ0HCL8_TRISK|nr:DUF3576 domain-containing protein [Tritonibacter scottomollicae]WOI32339.1 DUF3576 domain-containing protein [Tritonibacter scottomollicae]
MRGIKTFVLLSSLTFVTACGAFRSLDTSTEVDDRDTIVLAGEGREANDDKTTIWEAFGPRKSEQRVQVNRYLWAASLDVLEFLPVQSVDPFTGVIVTGYGTPPGGGRSYRATVHIKDPALEARSLNVALQSRGGAVSSATARAVEDAILTRARQLRIADKKI